MEFKYLSTYAFTKDILLFLLKVVKNTNITLNVAWYKSILHHFVSLKDFIPQQMATLYRYSNLDQISIIGVSPIDTRVRNSRIAILYYLWRNGSEIAKKILVIIVQI